MKINVLVVDDHQIVREGLVSILKTLPDIAIQADVANGREALDYIMQTANSKLPIELVITDIAMPEMNGLELTANIKKNGGCKVLILSMHDDEEYIHKAVEVGADGYLLKDSEKDELFRAIQKIINGEKYFSYNVSNILINNLRNTVSKQENEKSYLLSEREKEVLGLIVEGLSNKLIAAKLFVSTRTVDAHRYNIMQKIAVKNTAEMVRKAIEEKLIN
jgi:two-component system, NarL family, response regulator DegU